LRPVALREFARALCELVSLPFEGSRRFHHLGYPHSITSIIIYMYGCADDEGDAGLASPVARLLLEAAFKSDSSLFELRIQLAR
jgi:hypothetical protein